MAMKALPSRSKVFDDDDINYPSPRVVEVQKGDADMIRDVETGLDIDDDGDLFPPETSGRYAPRLYKKRVKETWKKRFIFAGALVFGTMTLTALGYVMSNALKGDTGSSSETINVYDSTTNLISNPPAAAGTIPPLQIVPPALSQPIIPPFYEPTLTPPDMILPTIEKARGPPPPPLAIIIPRPPRRNIHT